MRSRTRLFVLNLLAVSSVHAQATLYSVGDLGGGLYSEVRDATKSGGVIYAVGGAASVTGSTGMDTAFVWTSSSGVITPLPSQAGTSTLMASAITPDGAYIASRSRFDYLSSTIREAVRVTTSGLASLNLGNLAAGNYSASIAISSDGSVLYGFNVASGIMQAVRFTASGPTITAIPFMSGDNTNGPASHGTSADGKLMIGTSANTGTGGAGVGLGNHAFIYDHSILTVSAIPYLTGGNWNTGIAINSTGTLSLVAGNSTASTNGELYLFDGTTTTPLGSPSNSWVPTASIGGMTFDGSVVVNGIYLHNSFGWLTLDSVAAGAGVDMTNWSQLTAWGMSSDGSMIFGSGSHSGNTEGFVLEFSSSYLATAVPEPSAYAAILGLVAVSIAAYRRGQRPMS